MRVPLAPAGSEGTLPREITDLWEAHGGAVAWRDRAAVRFRYRVTAADGSEFGFPELRLRPGEPRWLWLDPSGEGDPIRVDLAGPPGSVWSAVEDLVAPGVGPLPATSEAVGDVELALRALPCFLGAPLSAARGRWEFRTLVPLAGVPAPPRVEVMPLWPAAVGPILLQPDAGSGLLASAVYGVRFPRFDPRPRAVTFAGHADFAGARIATLRIHARLPGTDPRAPRDPYAPAGAELEDAAWLLREEVTGIAFLTPLEAEAACPMPGAAPRGSRSLRTSRTDPPASSQASAQPSASPDS